MEWVLRRGSIPMNDRPYESWTTHIDVAFNFSDLSDRLGVLISRKAKKNEYLDINKAVSYMREMGYDRFDKVYGNECELIMPMSCTECSFDKDIELLSVRVKSGENYRAIVDMISDIGWDYEEIGVLSDQYEEQKPSYGGDRLYISVDSNKDRVRLIGKREESFKYFHIKPENYCTSIK